MSLAVATAASELAGSEASVHFAGLGMQIVDECRTNAGPSSVSGRRLVEPSAP